MRLSAMAGKYPWKSPGQDRSEGRPLLNQQRENVRKSFEGTTYSQNHNPTKLAQRASSAASCLLPELTETEAEFFRLVMAGDVQDVDRFIKENHNFNLNCQNYCGYTALNLAVLSENEDMLDFLLQFQELDFGESLLHAINKGSISVVEKLLDAQSESLLPGFAEDEELNFHASPYSADFSPEITPLMLAAHMQHYDIIKVLLSRGHTLTKPHPPTCFCKEMCAHRKDGENLRLCLARYNTYKALCSPSYICQTSADPILRAFLLSREMKECANVDREFKLEYLDLSEKLSDFAVDLMAQCRTTEEVETILHHTKGVHVSHKLKRFARAALAIRLEQKSFISHPHCQHVLRMAWLQNWHDWKTLNVFTKMMRVLPRMFLLPVMALIYWLLPRNKLVDTWRAPLNKYLSFVASYTIFLTVILVQIGIDYRINYRGPPATGLEWIIIIYVFGLMWKSFKTAWYLGVKEFFKQYWNIYDLVQLLWFFLTFLFWTLAYFDVELNGNLEVPRYKWHQYDYVLIAEGLYTYAVVFSFGKLLFFFQIGHELGSLQVSIGYMTRDIIRFMIFFSVIIVSFSVGMHMLYHSYGGLVGEYNGNSEFNQDPAFITYKNCLRNLYWAIYGYTPPFYADLVTMNYTEVVNGEEKEVKNHHLFTETVGQTVLATYYIIGILIMINMLIAMMSTSFSNVQENADKEWKFCRTKVWMIYFEEGTTLPPPFNLVPTPKVFFRVIKWVIAKLQGKNSAKCSFGKCCYFEDEEEIKEDRMSYQTLMSVLIQRFLTHNTEEGNLPVQHRIITQQIRGLQRGASQRHSTSQRHSQIPNIDIPE